jgi:hypothetical protein
MIVQMREVIAGNESPDPQSTDPQGGRDDEVPALSLRRS